MRRLICISIMMFAIGLASASAGTLVLNNFESQSDLDRLLPRGMSTKALTLSAEHATSGTYSSRVVYPEWSKGMDEWPAIILSMKNGIPANWSEYDVLVIDVHNASEVDADLAFYIRDNEGQNTAEHFAIPAGKHQTLRYGLDNAKIRLASIKEVHLFSTRPPKDLVLFIDNLRLEEDIIPRISAVEQRISAMKKEAVSLGLSTLAGDFERICQELRGRKANTVEARKTLRDEVAALEDRVRMEFPRAVSEDKMRRDFVKISPGTQYACGFASAMEKVFPKDVPFRARVSKSWSVELAGNEVESLQLLLLAGDQGLKRVRVAVSALVRTDGQAVRISPTSQVSPMGFVETKRPPYQVNYVGWHPDPILDFLTEFDVKPGEVQPVWIRVKAPMGTAPGNYRATITVTPANADPVTLGLNVRVWDFELPRETHLRTALSLREGTIRQVYGELTRVMWNKYCDFMLEYRLNPDNIYALNTPPMSDILRWCSKGANAYNVIYAMKPADLKPNALYPEDRKQHIMDQLAAIVPELKKHGVYDKAYLYGFDEVHPESYNAMKDILSTVKTAYPDLPILTTAYDDTFGEASGISAVDCWVPLTPKYNLERVAKARAQGKQVWWYTCIAPKSPYANWLVEYDAIDARSLMGVQTAKYQPDGYLYYAVNRWPLSKKPITEGPYTDWNPASFYDNNGDGSFMCAGPDGPLATIRMENIRDGIEDNEYFWLLRQEIERLRITPGPEAYRALIDARKAANIEDEVVKSLTQFSKSPDVLYKKRRHVAEAIIEARKVR